MKLIDKAAIVAEIKRIECETNYEPFTDKVLGKRRVCRGIKSFLDTLEVKEVDLDGEINLWVRNLHRVPNFEELNKFARHFFELGLKAQKGE